jgi:hypothetical protein
MAPESKARAHDMATRPRRSAEAWEVLEAKKKGVLRAHIIVFRSGVSFVTILV